MAKQKNTQNQTASHESENHLRASLSTAKDQISDFGSDFFSQLLGLGESNGPNEKAGIPPIEIAPQDNNTNEIFDFKKHNAEKLDKIAIGQQKFTQVSHPESNTYGTETKKNPEKKGAIDYTAEVLQTNKLSKRELREIDERIKEIMDELKKLIATSQILKMQFSAISVEQAPFTVGQYHLNFFELLLSLIKTARKNAEDAGAWIQATGNKNAKKQHKQFMKQGTKVTLSNERAIATQVG